jgi:hypothetical protein
VSLHVDTGYQAEHVIDDAVAAIEQPDPDGHGRDHGHRPGQQQGNLQGQFRGLADVHHQHRHQHADGQGDEGGDQAEEHRTEHDLPELRVGGDPQIVLEADEDRGQAAELLHQTELLSAGDELPDQRIAHADQQDQDGGDQQQIR